MSLAFDIKSFTGDSESFGALALLFILYGWSAINFSYLTGFIFKSYGNAQVATFFLHFIMVIYYFFLFNLFLLILLI
jgi:ATP-binding cassette, subfamily A (ABC1), member 3